MKQTHEKQQVNVINRLYHANHISINDIAEITGLPKSYIELNLLKKEYKFKIFSIFGKTAPMHDNELHYASDYAKEKLSTLTYNDVKKEYFFKK